jgi:general secretion pathway protein B
MSYILDALNKSEQEKTDTKTPGLNTVHQRVERNDSRGPQRWQYFLAIALTLNLLALGLWFAFMNSSPEIDSVNQPPPRTALPVVSQVSRSETAPSSLNEPRSAAPQTPSTSLPQANRGAMTTRPPPSMANPPFDVQSRLANIRFSSHIYAQDQALRMVVIDGQRMKEGDQLSGGIRLLNITEAGVVFTYQGDRFPIDVLSQWDN